MAIDFSVLKEKTNSIVEQFDHTHLNDIPCFSSINPSSENIAAYICELLEDELQGSGVKLIKVSVWESDTSRASYIP